MSQLEQLLATTERYQVVELKDFCEDSLIGSVEEDNVVRILSKYFISILVPKVAIP
jgi:hypothetical protein